MVHAFVKRCMHAAGHLSWDEEDAAIEYVARARQYFAEKDMVMWSKRPDKVARPVLLSDYQHLSKLCGYEYVGAFDAGGHINTSGIPSTIFSVAAAVRPFFSNDDKTSDTVVKESYYAMHMSLQRRQPTFPRVRQQ